MARPKLFIGSSSESMEGPASTLQHILQTDFTSVPWWLAPEFERGSVATLDSLLAATAAYDFAVFLLTPDDLTTSRSRRSRSPRDNVVFELGLFMGVLGPLRTLAILQAAARKTVKIPSDLYGISMARFTASADEHELRASLAAGAHAIRTALKSCRDWWHLRIDFSGGWNAVGNKFWLTILDASLKAHAWRLRHRALLLVVRRKNDAVDAMSDRRIALSALREVNHLSGDIRIEAASRSVIGAAGEREILQGFLFSMPHDADLSACTSINAIIENGGRLWKKVGISKGSDQ